MSGFNFKKMQVNYMNYNILVTLYLNSSNINFNALYSIHTTAGVFTWIGCVNACVDNNGKYI